jgi:RNA polymerase sigma-70 factor (ECF subfamily)
MAQPLSSSTDPGSPHDEVARHARFVRALAGDLARDAEEADEVAARTIAEAVTRAPNAGPSLRAWLRRVAWRTFRRSRRDEERRVRREAAAAQPEAQPSAVELAAEMELQKAIGAAFDALEEPYKSTLFRRYFHDETPTAIASASAVPLATVKSRLQRGLKLLRERLDATMRGGRDAWRSSALALASGGAPVVAAKSIGVPLAAAALLLAGATLWLARAPRAGSSSGTRGAPAGAVATSAAAPGESPATDAAPERASDRPTPPAPSALPFASGVVVDEAGSPLEGARLVAGTLQTDRSDGPFLDPIDDASLEERTLAHSDGRGRFTVADPSLGLALLHVVRDGFVPASLDDLSPDRAGNQERRIALRAGIPFEGDVVGTDGEPITTARVLVTLAETANVLRVARTLATAPTYRSSSSIPTWWHAVDKDGRFRCRALEGSKTVVWAIAPGYATASNERFDGSGPAHVVLRRDSILVDARAAEDGSRLEEARCFLHDADSQAILATGTSFWLGDERIERMKQDWVARADGRTLRLTVVAPGRRSATRLFPFHRNDEPPRFTVALEAGEDPPSIRGRVIGTSEATVTIAWAPSPTPGISHGKLSTVLELRTGPDGTFAARGLPDGDYRVTASAPRCTKASVDTLAPGGDVTLELVATAALVARVVDETGAPLSGTVVHVETADHDHAWVLRTDEGGCARFPDLPATTCFAFARQAPSSADSDVPPHPLGERCYSPADAFELAPGDTAERTLVAPRRVATYLRVVDEDGAPIARTELQLSISGRGGCVGRMSTLLREPFKRMLVTDAAGRAEFSAWPGGYEVAFVRDDFVNLARFDVADGERADVVCTVPTPSRRAPLRGRVVDDASGDPIAGARVVVSVLRGGEQVAASDWGSFYSPAPKEVRSDADGRFVVERVPVGDVSVWCSSDPDYCRVGQPVTLADDGASLTIRAVRAIGPAVTTSAAHVHVRVRTVDRISNRPVEGVTVLIEGSRDDAVHSLAIARTDVQGEVELDVPRFERYAVRFSGPFSNLPPPVVTHARARVDASPVDGAVDVRIALERLPIGERY